MTCGKFANTYRGLNISREVLSGVFYFPGLIGRGSSAHGLSEICKKNFMRFPVFMGVLNNFNPELELESLVNSRNLGPTFLLKFALQLVHFAMLNFSVLTDLCKACQCHTIRPIPCTHPGEQCTEQRTETYCPKIRKCCTVCMQN